PHSSFQLVSAMSVPGLAPRSGRVTRTRLCTQSCESSLWRSARICISMVENPSARRRRLDEWRSSLKITTIETFPVDVDGRNLIFLKVNTDEGITGIGEAYSVGPDL